MAFDLWTHQFCLSCDKQTDGATYCSESCRLADYEKTCSTPSSAPTSGFSVPSSPYTTQSPTKFYLSPAYDFSAAQPYGSTPLPQSYFPQRTASTPSSSQPRRTLTPSSSHSSLCSMQSFASSSSSEAQRLSEKSKKELKAYAVSFEQVRMQRRRSH